jgi:hypothetical protein
MSLTFSEAYITQNMCVNDVIDEYHSVLLTGIVIVCKINRMVSIQISGQCKKRSRESVFHNQFVFFYDLIMKKILEIDQHIPKKR